MQQSQVDVVFQIDVREELAKLGKFLPIFIYELIQSLITEITGKPYRGQKPLFNKTPLFHLLIALVCLIGGVTISTISWRSAPWILPISWIYTVGGARDLQVNICHQCIHRNFFGGKADRWLTEIISTILFLQNYDGYFHDHVRLHHNRKHFTNFVNDPDAAFLWKLGFRPGLKDTKSYWRLLFKVIVSPKFHWLFLQARLKANFINSPLYRRFMSVSFVFAVGVLITVTNSLTTFIAVWVFPLTIPYHIASLLQFISEHDWAGNGSIESKCHGRFCGDPPPFGQSFLNWVRWGIRIPYQYVVRIAVLQGGMPQHDFHHLSPLALKEWANETYIRQREVETGKNYIEFWGLENVINHVFQSFVEVSDPVYKESKLTK